MRDDTLSFRRPAGVTLTHQEAKLLIDEGRELFARLKLTAEAKEYLKYHEKLAEVIAKW